MASLKGSKTEENLKAAFAGESQANRRYLYFAQKADVEGYNDVATVFRSTAEGETGHAHGHLEYLEPKMKISFLIKLTQQIRYKYWQMLQKNPQGVLQQALMMIKKNLKHFYSL